jgi:hypothetical protein
MILLGVSASALNYECDAKKNFITGIPYTQISLTDACNADMVCDANPIYGPKNCPMKALKYCKAKCDEQTGCVGLFFQKHMNGHEICGFYHGRDASTVMHSSKAKWVQHHHKRGAICEVVPEATTTPEFKFGDKQSTPAPSEAHIIRATIQFASAVAGNGAFELAFQTVIAHAAGHVCGADASEACSPNEIILTSSQGASVAFSLKVANGHVATQAVANIRSAIDEGSAGTSVFAAQLAAAGFTDVDTIKKMVFGDVKVDAEAKQEEAKQQESGSEASPTSIRFHRLLRMFRCPKFWGGILCITIGIAALVYVCKRSSPITLHVVEVPAEATVVKEGTTYTAVEMGKDETSKEQV